MIEDPDGDRLRALARCGGTDPRPLLADERTFGSLAGCPRFAEALARDLQALAAGGVHATIAARLAPDVAGLARAA